MKVSSAPELERLIEGNKHFRDIFFDSSAILFEQLVTYGQKPKIMVIACSDSRVDPALIFNSEPGQLFVVRNVANLVPPYNSFEQCNSISAALEFGVSVLGVDHIIVLGHSHCGGIASLLEEKSKEKQNCITTWMKPVRRVCSTAEKDNLDQCAKTSVINSVTNLSSFAFINESIKNGSLALHGWYFDIATGSLSKYDTDKKRWHSLY